MSAAPRRSLLPPVSRRLRHRMARQVRALRRGERELPTYFIVGAKRAGTTSVDEYLVEHPLVVRGLVEKGCRYYDVNYHRGPAWFRSHLPLRADIDRLQRTLGSRPVFGESSPYYSFHPDAPARIAADVPGARLLFVLRDPVERAWSHYRYEVARGFEDLAPDAALSAESGRLRQADEQARWFSHRHHSYVGRSRYAEGLRRLLDHFPTDQVLLVRSEDVFTAPQATMARVFEHVGVAPYVSAHYRAHKALGADDVPASFRATVEEAVDDDLDQLARLAPDFPRWGR